MADISVSNEDATCLKYRCCICSSILRNPVKLKCGHRYCQTCINTQIETIIQCLQCNEKTLKNEIVIDQDFKLAMESSDTICRLCNWNGFWKDYQDHLERNHSNIICNTCKKMFRSITDFDQHKIACSHCKRLPSDCHDQSHRKTLFKHCVTEKRTFITNISQKNMCDKIRQLAEEVRDISKQYQAINNRMTNMNNLLTVNMNSSSNQLC